MTLNNRSIADQTYTLPDGQVIAYYDSGSASVSADTTQHVIVLLHGFCGSSAYWGELIPLLSGEGRVIAPDLRGHGLSTAPDQEAYEMGDFARDLKLLLGHLNVSTVHLFGHSLGGYVSLAFAESYSEQLDALGLIHSTAKADSAAAQANRDKAAHALKEGGIQPFVEGLVPKLFAPNHKSSMADRVQAMIEAGYETSAAGAAATALGMKARPDRTAVLDGLTVPLLLIAGSEDGIILPANTFTSDGPQVKQVLLEGCGHMSMVEDPNKLAGELAAFLHFHRV
ncbi:alpha/beta fold hydrolase [Paenibacillus sp. R14(2021)]|uniref:alpha/beta fold hydrolase n=1 Tax=Paenibacillus sp. R14(2021) TaxID=2859228 RepID=UPI001C615C72|nr:alpha/beta hydrolase [Paenibacillus sp. R14(2021)]